jgi:hypothetical protein
MMRWKSPPRGSHRRLAAGLEPELGDVDLMARVRAIQ